MTPRNRDQRNKGLPDWLYLTHAKPNKKGLYYWKYCFPGRDVVKFTATRAVAIANIKKANAINAQNMPALDKFVGKAKGRTVQQGFDAFLSNYLPLLKLKPVTVEDKERRLRIMGAQLGHIEIKNLSVEAVAAWLNQDELGSRTRNVYRTTLIQVIKYWRSEGWIDHDPASATLIKPRDKQRQRLELNQWIDIHSIAAPAMQRAMELALITAQRRADISRMSRHNVIAGRLRVLQHKGEGKATETRISIPLTATQPDTGLVLGDVIDSCFGDGIATNYLVHHPIGSAGKTGKPFEPVTLTREFTRLRKLSGHEWDKSPPTFHEQRSLSGRLYRHAGRSEAWVQELLGHEDAQTTRESYLSNDQNWLEISW